MRSSLLAVCLALPLPWPYPALPFVAAACRPMHCSLQPAADLPRRWLSGGDRVLADVVPVDVLSQAGPGGDVDVAFLVHWIVDRLQPGRLLLVIEEGVQQPALVVLAGDAHRRQTLEVSRTRTVQLEPHAKGLAEMRNLHHRRDAPHIHHSRAQEVGGALPDPLSPRVE